MYRAIARNKRSTVGIFAVFFVILGVLGSVANALYAPRGTYWVLVVVLIGAALSATIQYFAAGRQAVAVSGAVPIRRSDDPRLHRIVENLPITTGTPMPAVSAVPDPAPNAFATGRDPAHAIVAATTGLLQPMDDDEPEGRTCGSRTRSVPACWPDCYSTHPPIADRIARLRRIGGGC